MRKKTERTFTASTRSSDAESCEPGERFLNFPEPGGWRGDPVGVKNNEVAGDNETGASASLSAAEAETKMS